MPPLSVAVFVSFLEFRDASGWVVLCGTVALVLFILFIEEMWVCGPVFGNKKKMLAISKQSSEKMTKRTRKTTALNTR